MRFFRWPFEPGNGGNSKTGRGALLNSLNCKRTLNHSSISLQVGTATVQMKRTESDDEDDFELKQFKVRAGRLCRTLFGNRLIQLFYWQVILLGDGAVGKTSIANRYCYVNDK